ncbi:hypothetical protein CSQ92_24695 [Janthinobacterium sp. BJB446]|nr:hypothetical protein CSQ92_24695 [Janthinobacterium sp. BJB446]
MSVLAGLCLAFCLPAAAQKPPAAYDLKEIMTVRAFDQPVLLEKRTSYDGLLADKVQEGAATRMAGYAQADQAMTQARYPGAQRLGVAELADYRPGAHITMVDRYMIEHAASALGKGWIFAFMPVNFIQATRIKDESARGVPFVLPGTDKTLNYTFQINLPDNVNGLLDPTTTRYNGDFFTYKQSQQFRGNVARITLELSFRADSVPVRELDKFLAQLQHISQMMGGSFSVPEMWINSNKPGTAANTPGQRMRSSLEKDIAEHSATIARKQEDKQELAQAYWLRGSAHADLQQAELAWADLTQALALQPSTAVYHMTLASIQVRRGQFQAAIEQLEQARLLGYDAYEVAYQRGQTYYQMGQYRRALDELEPLTISAVNMEAQPYARLWYLWTLGPAGLALPDALRQELNADASGAWPRPAYGLFTGISTPEQVLAAADTMQGDERLLSLCEAYFNIGQYYLLKQDRRKAREYFEKTVATGMVMYAEYGNALFELQRLAQTPS